MRKNNKTGKPLVELTSRAFVSLADIFVFLPCRGDLYEPKVPKQLLEKQKA